MPFTPINFENLPSTNTPINAARLNFMQTQYSAAMEDSALQSVPRSTAANVAYTTGAGGAQSTTPIAQGLTSNSIVQRSGDQIVVPFIPAQSSHAASKAYVDANAGGGGGGSSADLVSEARWPVYISHRGAPLVYPEHSMEAYQASFDAGFSPEADVRALSDGTLVCVHDATTNRTMSLSKSVSATTVAEWRTATINPPSHLSRVFGTGRGTPVFFNDYLDRFGGKQLLWVEIKDTGQAASDVISAVISRGLARAVVLQSSSITICQEIVGSGGTALLLTDSIQPSEIASSGIEFVGVSGSATNAYVTSLNSAGIKAIAYTQNTKSLADAQIARGCSGVFSDDPWEVSREFTRETYLDLSDGFLPPAISHNRGHSGGASGAGTTQVIDVVNNSLSFTNNETAQLPNCIKLGSLGYGSPTLRIRLWAQAMDPSPGTTQASWMFGVYLGRQTGDAAVNEEATESQFRLAMIRRDGRKHIYNKPTMASGITAVASSVATTPPYAAAGGRSAPMLFEIEFTTTQVTIRNLTTNDADLVGTHAAWSGQDNYVTLNVNGGNSMVWGIHAVR